MKTLKNFKNNSKSLNSKAKRELERINEIVSNISGYQEQKQYLKGKTFIDSFHR